jgi:hypothetical protein
VPKLVGIRTTLLVRVDQSSPNISRTCDVIDAVQDALENDMKRNNWDAVKVDPMPRFVPEGRDCKEDVHDFYVVSPQMAGGATLAGNRVCRRCGKVVS